MIVKDFDLKSEASEERHYVEPRSIPDSIGAYVAISGIKDSFTLMHTPIGCAKRAQCYIVYETNDESQISCTGLAERDVIFGGEERLLAAIEKAVELFKPAIICVVVGTVGALIGDDVEGMVTSARHWLAEKGDTQIPIINVPTSMLEGNKTTGFNLVLEALVDNVVEKPAQSMSKTVNIFGVTADAHNAEADVMEIKRLLGQLGIHVQEVFCCNAEVDKIRRAAEANLNLVVSELIGVEAAKRMEQRFGLPFRLVPYPIGMTNTRQFLQVTADFFGIEGKRVDELIAGETETVHAAMRKAMFWAGEMRGNPLVGSTAAVVGDSMHVLGVTRFLIEEWGVKPELMVLKTYWEKSLEMLAEMDKDLGLEAEVLLNPSRPQIRHAFEEKNPRIVLGGNDEKLSIRELGLDKTGTTFVHIATYPCGVNTSGRVDIFPHPFAGFQGVIYLSELIVNELIRTDFEKIWATYPGWPGAKA